MKYNYKTGKSKKGWKRQSEHLRSKPKFKAISESITESDVMQWTYRLNESDVLFTAMIRNAKGRTFNVVPGNDLITCI